MIIYAATVFISAFLLFLVQPILAKYILPWFGGSPGVWTTCLLFFQVLLTAGYGMSHLLVQKLSPRRQVSIILALLLLTIALLPITPSKSFLPESISTPTWHIIKLLFASVGMSYFLLSSISPLLQSWFHRTLAGDSPYRLYTLSNLGSLIAIVGYPFVIEPNLGLGFQTRFWSCLYLVFAVLLGLCALQQWKARFLRHPLPAMPVQEHEKSTATPIRWKDCVMWLSAAALSAGMLMATTNQLCQDVAVVPLLWLLPMGLYLLSYILCFHHERWYSRLGFGIALAVALGQTCWILYQGIHIGVPLQIFSYSFTLFVICMMLHGELVRLKPSPRHLTSFYLMISAGSAMGGAFVTLIAPQIFKGYWEFHLGLAGSALFFLTVLFRDREDPLHGGRPFWAWSVLCLAFVVLAAVLDSQIQSTLTDVVTIKRNFFGTLKILNENPLDLYEHRIVLMHGRIEHGYQFVSHEKHRMPTSYFGPNSGAGIAIRLHPRKSNLRIGVIGLGTGTLAAYGRQGDYFRFYEINPDVLHFCNKYFTYCKDSPAQVDVVLGDARISMEREKSRNEPGNFDIFAVDAFSSDAIPVHLLTREFYSSYWYHLKNDGILALHISSRYFNLSPVIQSLADLSRESGAQALLIEDPGSHSQETDATRWILITANKEFLADPQVKSAVSPWTEEDSQRLLFTDDYSNIFRLLK
ncbi:MAG: fused MFS/spermidine synthase [Acidobacteria bacterium]|nr:fused MFS/spermidine synthase [Acidobacteriota bacterium]